MRIVLSAVTVVAVAVSLTSCVRFAKETFSDQQTITERVSEIRVDNGSGDVKVRSVDGATATEVKRVVEYPREADKPSAPTHRLEGGRLVLTDCGGDCSVNYEVTVPTKDVKITGDNSSGDVEFEGVAGVDITVGSGNATVRAVSGSVRVSDKSGDVTVTDVGGEFNGSLSSGNARLSAMRGEVVVDNKSGDVDIDMAEARSVRASASSGNVNVKVPRSAYRVDAQVDSGEKDVQVQSDPSARVELVLRTNSGDLTVRSA